MKSFFSVAMALAFFLVSAVFAQEVSETRVEEETGETNVNPREERPFGVSAQIGGTSGIAGLSIDLFVVPQVSLEISGVYGLIVYGFCGGIMVHPWGGNENAKWSPYIGLASGCIRAGLLSNDPVNLYPLYPRLGVNYIGPKGFNFSTEIGYMLAYDFHGDVDNRWVESFPFGGIKLGYRF